MPHFFIIALSFTLIWTINPNLALANDTGFVVTLAELPDEKSVFATVESLDVIPARTRISGTVAELKVAEGDRVEQGQVIALISDDKNALRIRSVNAQIAAARSEQANAETELDRAQDLFDRGIIPKARFDAAKTRAEIANGQLRSLTANRNVISQHVREGQVLAPTSGRVLTVQITAGTVVMPGEIMASIAAENFVLRLALPERHARFLTIGASVRVDGSLMDGSANTLGKITKVYPQIRDGRVIADAIVPGLGDFFVGERVRVWVPTQARKIILIPEKYLITRFGNDLVNLQNPDEDTSQIVVQRGRQIGDMVEILAGLRAGDRVLTP